MKSKIKKPLSSYERARKRVDDIKSFYGHLTAYIVINIILLLTRNNYNFFPENNVILGDSDFLNWINWETYGTPIAWGIGLTIHAITVFFKNPFLGKDWEERQIQKYINSDKQ